MRPLTLESVSHIYPLCLSMLERRGLPRQRPTPDMTNPGRSFPPPEESPGSITEVEGLPIGTCLQKHKISGETTKLVCLPSVASPTDFTISLSLVTGKPKSRVVHHTVMSHVSHILVSQWSAPPFSLSPDVRNGKCFPCVSIRRRSLVVSLNKTSLIYSCETQKS